MRSGTLYPKYQSVRSRGSLKEETNKRIYLEIRSGDTKVRRRAWREKEVDTCIRSARLERGLFLDIPRRTRRGRFGEKIGSWSSLV